MLAQVEERLDGPLTIERIRYGGDILVFSLSGELDLAVTADAWRVIEPALDEPEAMVVIDLTELELIDAKGVALLYGLVAGHPGKDTLRLLSSRREGVNRVLRLTGVDSVIQMG
jgi:anti-anti-sigma factor